MKLWLIISFFLYLLLSKESFSQNLVPNPSFESYDTCPSTGGQIFYADFWFQPNIANGTWQSTSSSDYYNACAAASGMSVPTNIAGFQAAHTGNAYSGIFFYAPGDFREYIEIRLMSPLQTAKKYCSGYYVSRAEVNARACDRQEAYFSNNNLFYNSPAFAPLPFTPQIGNQIGNCIADSINWVLIKGEFTAQGGEEFMTIGNFRDNNSTTVINLGATTGAVYYYIDDVFVEEMQVDTANAGGDKSVCQGDSTRLGIVAGSGCIYTWQPATGLRDTTSAQPLASPAQTTIYVLTVHDTSTGTLCDWTSTDTVTVYVDPPCPPPPPPEQPVEIYNIFTPNGDGKNDFFFVKNLPANSALQIFNRWGGRVFQSSNYSNTWNGGGVPDGTYYYILVLPSKESYHGFVEIRR